MEAIRKAGENLRSEPHSRCSPAGLISRLAVCAAVLLVVSAGSAVAGEPQSGGQGQPAAGTSGPRAPDSENPIDYTTARLTRVVRALRITERITIDGRLDEPAWRLAVPATDFIQWEPSPGMPASDKTEMRFLYDADNLYIGARCFDSDPAGIIVNEVRKDFAPEGDAIGLFLDTLHDGQSGYVFQTNPAGARRDVQYSNDGEGVNADWDGVWETKGTIDEEGWTTEIVIPFKTLRFSDSPHQEWGLNLLRRLRRTNEDSHWSPLPRRYRLGRASMAGTLTGLEGIHQGRNLKIKPFVISSVTEVGTAPHTREIDGGLDLKYGITPSMTLDLTYRTEFSQVEVDQQQVNLTRFNLFFPEKREFFLENATNFAVAGGGVLAGGGGGAGAANVIPFFSRRVGLSPTGTPVPILGGGRVSGKVGTYDIGVLAMRTKGQEDIPADNFLVGRVRKNFRGNSSAGAILTSRDPTVGGHYNRLYGVDTFLRFFEKLEVTSYLLRTDTPGLTGRNQARLLGAEWNDNDLTLSGSYQEVQPNFRPEMGFVGRTDMTHYAGNLSWRPRPQRNPYIRNYNLGFTTNYYVDEHGRPETRQNTASTGISFQDSSVLSVSATRTFDHLSAPFEIRPTVVLPPGDYTYQRYAVSFNSDRSRTVSGRVEAGAGEFWNGHSRSVTSSLELRPSYHLNINLSVSRNDVDLPAGEFTTTLVGARVLVGFTSKRFLSTFLQYNAATNQFSANTRLNIVHRPLSDLYVVYNDRRDTALGTLLERSFIVKFTNLFDF